MNVRRLSVLTGAVCAIFLSGLMLAAWAAEPEKPSSQTPDLLARIAQLEQRVAQLEKQQQLSQAAAQARATLTQPVPQNWRRREINGMTYYIVPLKSGSAPAVLAAPSAKPADGPAAGKSPRGQR